MENKASQEFDRWAEKARPAMAEVRAEALKGDCAAQFLCSQMHKNGEETLIDYEKALYWCERAAKNGFEGATEECAFLELCMMSYDVRELQERNKLLQQYAEATGRTALQEADVRLARDWYEATARQGDAQAQFACGMLYYKDTTQEQDAEAAYFWFEKAALQDHPRAQFYCGKLCYYSFYDRERGKEWMEKAVHNPRDRKNGLEAFEVLFNKEKLWKTL